MRDENGMILKIYKSCGQLLKCTAWDKSINTRNTFGSWGVKMKWEMGMGNTNEMIFPNFSPKTVLSTCCRCIAWASAADNFVFIVQFYFESVSNRVIAEIVTRVKKKKTNRKVAKSEPESPKRTPFVISFAWAPHKFLFLFSVVDFLFIHFIFFATTGEKKSLLFRYCSSKLLFYDANKCNYTTGKRFTMSRLQIAGLKDTTHTQKKNKS